MENQISDLIDDGLHEKKLMYDFLNRRIPYRVKKYIKEHKLNIRKVTRGPWGIRLVINDAEYLEWVRALNHWFYRNDKEHPEFGETNIIIL
mgnify:CR=1 FL=1